MIDLAHWNDRLSQHFCELREARRASGVDRPIFALEHGLTPPEVETLANAVCKHVDGNAPSNEHALAWIAYAAEIGYRYSGDEYWQTFERETPGWTKHGDRYWIRDRYRNFARELGGAVPRGAWAKHFSIICWPITHAILPCDLQRQLARILYELRHSFSADVLESPSKLGELVAARSFSANSRFRNLTQDPQLVGQISAALLLQGKLGTAGLIHTMTLQRIGENLDEERRARTWLRRARQCAEERARIRGLAPSGSRGLLEEGPREQARSKIAALGIEPRLVLRPLGIAGESWDVFLEISDLSQLLLRIPGAREVLTDSRCVVAGASGRPLARGRCLHGTQRIRLGRWPREDEVLLHFEQQDEQLNYLLDSECLLRPGPAWLFRIASDGLAYESRSLRVRPGERYIIVRADGPVEPIDQARPVELKCSEAYGAVIELPSSLDKNWEASLSRLGLRQAKTIEVWPAGLAAAAWDGEGYGEWLASERPCLGICADHPIAGLLVSMDTGSYSEVTSVPPGDTVFVQLPQLPGGLHTVHVHTRRFFGEDPEALGDVDVVMRIREVQPSSPRVNPQGPLVVQVEPAVPTLEELWEGRIEISLRGPMGRQVQCRASLFGHDEETAAVSEQLPPIKLPVEAERWRQYFNTYFQKTPASRAYDTARVCELEFTAKELGTFSIRCEREFTPLRWAVRRSQQEWIVRLLDDSGTANPPAIARLAFEEPCIEEPLEPAATYSVPGSGSLYVARHSELTAAVIVPQVVHGINDLRCFPRIHEVERSPEAVRRILSRARLWSQARLPGDLFSAMRRREVLQALTAHIFKLVGGKNWGDVEESVHLRRAEIGELRRLVSKGSRVIDVGAELERDIEDLAAVPAAERVERFTALVRTARLLPSAMAANSKTGNSKVVQRSKNRREDGTEWFCEFVLRLASDPAVIEHWAGDHLHEGLRHLFDASSLARVARFAVIAIDRHLGSSPLGSRELYAGWGWT